MSQAQVMIIIAHSQRKEQPQFKLMNFASGADAKVVQESGYGQVQHGAPGYGCAALLQYSSVDDLRAGCQPRLPALLHSCHRTP